MAPAALLQAPFKPVEIVASIVIAAIAWYATVRLIRAVTARLADQRSRGEREGRRLRPPSRVV